MSSSVFISEVYVKNLLKINTCIYKKLIRQCAENGTPGFSLVSMRAACLERQAEAWRSIYRIIFFIFIIGGLLADVPPGRAAPRAMPIKKRQQAREGDSLACWRFRGGQMSRR